MSQNDTALTSWFSQCWGTINRSCNLYYQEPENLLTSVSAFIEGYQINAVPGSTTFTLSLSPLQYYQFFTLDNSTFGVLGGGTIYYDQPEIVYDEFEWTYNDVDASNSASRLGW
ncbi:MAG: hypothetical protein EBU90_13195 [Proteobacteria bacterium]|nr:hypothetical protein [Pseudomonadota bacterium]